MTIKTIKTIKTIVNPVDQTARIAGLNHLQQAALERAFALAHGRGLPPGDLLRIVSQHVEAARAAAGNPFAGKLDSRKAQAIRTARKGGATYADLGREYGVSDHSIRSICKGQTHKVVLKSVKKGRAA